MKKMGTLNTGNSFEAFCCNSKESIAVVVAGDVKSRRYILSWDSLQLVGVLKGIM